MAKMQIHGSQIKDETINGSQIQDNTIDSADIKDGSIVDIDIATNANINADKIADGTKNKVFTVDEKSKLSSIEDGANKYIHPDNHPATMITEDINHKFVTDSEKTAWNNKLDSNANAVSSSKLQTARKISLEGAVSGEVDFDGSSNVIINTTISGAIDIGDLDISDIEGLQNTLDGKASLNHNHNDVTTSKSGFMIASDKAKLDGIEPRANNYTLPTATNSVFGGVKTGSNIINNDGIISVADGTKTSKGVVQLTDSVTSTSGTTAATANAVKVVNDKLTTHVNNDSAHVSALERAQWDAKATVNYVDTKIAKLVNSAPETLDTLGELADAIKDTDDALDGLITTVGTKASDADLTSHTGNTTVHITADERTTWNAKANNIVATTTEDGLMSSNDKNKLSKIIAKSLQIPVDSYSVVWTHNFGSTNYAITTIADQPSINIYFKNKNATSVEIVFYEILGTHIETYAAYDNSKPINIDAMLMPLN